MSRRSDPNARNGLTCDVADDRRSPRALTASRARARAWDPDHMARKLRKGRDRCTATRRDGQPCQAPAIAEGLVCRRHGGAAPQVRIAARHRQLQLALYVATREFDEAYGTARQFDALCRAVAAGRDLDDYEAKMALVAKMRRAVKLRAELEAQQAPDEARLSQS